MNQVSRWTNRLWDKIWCINKRNLKKIKDKFTLNGLWLRLMLAIYFKVWNLETIIYFSQTREHKCNIWIKLMAVCNINKKHQVHTLEDLDTCRIINLWMKQMNLCSNQLSSSNKQYLRIAFQTIHAMFPSKKKWFKARKWCKTNNNTIWTTQKAMK